MNSSQNDQIKFVPKGWGYEKWITNGPLYCGKILFFCKGKMCSWHYHENKDEVFYVHTGNLYVYWGMSDDYEMAYLKVLKAGDKFHVPTGMRHRMEAIEDTTVFEFSTQHFDEDSIRLIKGD